MVTSCIFGLFLSSLAIIGPVTSTQTVAAGMQLKIPVGKVSREVDLVVAQQARRLNGDGIIIDISFSGGDIVMNNAEQFVWTRNMSFAGLWLFVLGNFGVYKTLSSAMVQVTLTLDPADSAVLDCMADFLSFASDAELAGAQPEKMTPKLCPLMLATGGTSISLNVYKTVTDMTALAGFEFDNVLLQADAENGYVNWYFEGSILPNSPSTLTAPSAFVTDPTLAGQHAYYAFTPYIFDRIEEIFYDSGVWTYDVAPETMALVFTSSTAGEVSYQGAISQTGPTSIVVETDNQARATIPLFFTLSRVTSGTPQNAGDVTMNVYIYIDVAMIGTAFTFTRAAITPGFGETTGTKILSAAEFQSGIARWLLTDSILGANDYAVLIDRIDVLRKSFSVPGFVTYDIDGQTDTLQAANEAVYLQNGPNSPGSVSLSSEFSWEFAGTIVAPGVNIEDGTFIDVNNQ